MADQARIDLLLNTGDSAKTLGDLELRAEALTEALKGVDVGSENFNKLKAEMIKTNREVKNLELSFEALDSEQVASEVGSVAGAIGDVGTGLVLLSGGNEELEAMVSNIENALGVSMALKGGIEGLSSARKLWNDAMARGNQLTKIAIVLQQKLNQASKANIFLAFAAAVAAVAAAILVWGKNASATEQAQEALNDAAIKGAAAAGKEEAKIKVLAVTLMDATASTEARTDALEKLNEILPDSIGLITEETIATGEAVEAIQKYIETVKIRAELAASEELLQEQIAKRLEMQMQLTLAGADANSEAGDKLRLAIEEMKGAENVILNHTNSLNKQLSALDDGVVAQSKSNQEIEKNTRFTKENTQAKKDNADADREAEDLLARRIAAQKELDKMEIDAIEDQWEKKRALAVWQFEQEIANLDENIKEENDLIIAKRLELQDTLREIDVAEYEEQVVAEIERQFAELERYQEFEAEKTRIAEEEENKRKEQAEKARELLKQGAQDLLNATEKLANFQSAKELQRAKEKVARGEKLSKAEVKRLERQDKINKAFAVAQIAADTARGIGAAIAAGAGIPFPGNLGAIASGVAAVIAGSVQAAQVLGESPDIPSLPETSADIFADQTDSAQGQPNVNDFGFGSTILNQPNKVYVVESDITNAQGSVASIEEQATFG